MLTQASRFLLTYSLFLHLIFPNPFGSTLLAACFHFTSALVSRFHRTFPRILTTFIISSFPSSFSVALAPASSFSVPRAVLLPINLSSLPSHTHFHELISARVPSTLTPTPGAYFSALIKGINFHFFALYQRFTAAKSEWSKFRNYGAPLKMSLIKFAGKLGANDRHAARPARRRRRQISKLTHIYNWAPTLSQAPLRRLYAKKSFLQGKRDSF